MQKETKHLYSIVLEYDGGTYVEQIYAIENETLADILQKWLQTIQEKEIITEDFENLSMDLLDQDNSPIGLEGLLNIWCTSLSTSKGMALIHIIKTDDLAL